MKKSLSFSPRARCSMRRKNSPSWTRKPLPSCFELNASVCMFSADLLKFTQAEFWCRPKVENGFFELHEAHPGVTKMKSLARSFVWWPKMDATIEELVRQCPSCQLIQKTPPNVPLRPWSWPDASWKRVHVDFSGHSGDKCFWS